MAGHVAAHRKRARRVVEPAPAPAPELEPMEDGELAAESEPEAEPEVEPEPPRKRRRVRKNKAAPEADAPAPAADEPAPAATTDDDSGSGSAAGMTSAMSERQKRRHERKVQKMAQRKLSEQPELVLSADVKEIKFKDIRDLVLWTLADGVNTLWMLVRHKHNIHHMALVVVNGLYAELVKRHAKALPTLTKTFIGPVVTTAPGTKNRIHSSMQCLLQVPMSNTQKRKKAELHASPEYQAAQAAKVKPLVLTGVRVLQPENLLMSTEVMRQNNYFLLEDRDKFEAATLTGFVATRGLEGAEALETFVTVQNAPMPPQGERLLAIDCEMCRTVNGLELARISVVNEQQQVLYDSFVLPEGEIVDYNTRWSGITPETLANVRTRLVHVQEKLLEMLTPETILIGHSLENDLRAIKLFHNRVIDTALVYEHPRGPPQKPSLRWLAEKHLRKVIQGGDKGHDSIEDARAAMMLVLLKLEQGTIATPEAEPEDVESLFRRLDRQGRKSAYVDTALSVRTNGKPPVTACAAKDDDEAIELAQAQFSEKHFVMLRLTALETYMRSLENDDAAVDDKAVRDILAATDARIAALVQTLPANTLVTVVSGHGDMVEARRLMEANKTLASAVAAANEPKLEQAIARGRAGVSFFCLAQGADETADGAEEEPSAEVAES